MAEVQKSVMVPIDQCEAVEWNPNVEDLATFNALVEAIAEHGFTDPLEVVEADGVYRIVGGEHRWKAAKQVGLKKIPVVVRDWTEDEQKMNNVRLNQLRGRMDPQKFARLYDDLRTRHDRDTLMSKMGFASREKELERLIGSTRNAIPKDRQEEFDRRAEKIQTVEDLASVVQSLYSRAGSTLTQSGYMFLTYGGQTHLMVRMSNETKKRLTKILTAIGEAGGNADELAASMVEELALTDERAG